MNLFFDTSALVKYFHEEAGSKRVRSLIDDPEHAVFLSELAQVEFVSAVHRKHREGALTAEQLREALAGFAETVRAFHVEPLGGAVIREAEQLLIRHARNVVLRTLDALHLATYVLIAAPSWRFVVSDDRLRTAAQREGCRLINP